MSDERDVHEVLARYVRAADLGDGPALAALFMADGCVELFRSEGEELVPTGKVEGSAGVGKVLAEMEDRVRLGPGAIA